MILNKWRYIAQDAGENPARPPVLTGGYNVQGGACIVHDDNCYLVDWLSFRCESMDENEMIDYLGLGSGQWDHRPGFYGYRCRIWFNGISIHYANEDLEGVLVEMSGQGCRTFETFAELAFDDSGTSCNAADWGLIFSDILHDDDFVVTRLDLAFDDHTGLIPMKRLIHDFRHENFVSRFKSKSCKIEMSPNDEDATLYFGSRQSELLFRIYDKAAERGYTGKHWVRFEMQLRRDLAYNMIDKIVKAEYAVGSVFAGVVENYLRIVKPSKDDSNKRRWDTAPYWKKLVGEALPLSLWVKKDIEYNKFACERYVYGMAGNSVRALIELEGLERFAELLEKRRSKKVNPKIRAMVATELALKNGDAILDEID